MCQHILVTDNHFHIGQPETALAENKHRSTHTQTHPMHLSQGRALQHTQHLSSLVEGVCVCVVMSRFTKAVKQAQYSERGETQPMAINKDSHVP